MALSWSRSSVCLSIGVVVPPLGFACAGDRFGELDILDAAYSPSATMASSAETGTNALSPGLPKAEEDAGSGKATGDALPPTPGASASSDAGADDGSARTTAPPHSDASDDVVSDTSGDAGSSVASYDADAGVVACTFDGTWASRLTIEVSWVPQGLMGAILAPGSSQMEQWILSTRVTSGGMTADTALLCGIALPDFSGTQIAGGEKYGIVFPDAMFDSGVLPSFAIGGSIVGSGPGAIFNSMPSAVLLGLTLSNPTTDPWPSSIASPLDSDHDGKPGVTALVAQGSGYSDVIVDTVGDRANELYVAIRQVTSVTATAMDCNTFDGTITIPQIMDGTGATKYAIDSHVIGCRLDVDAGDCYSVQGAFVDATQPVFTPSGNGSFTSVRVPGGATCATVRQKLP